jgi:hypothetical protein
MNRNIVYEIDTIKGDRIKVLAYFNSRRTAEQYVKLFNKYTLSNAALYDDKDNYICGYTANPKDIEEAVRKQIEKESKKEMREDEKARAKIYDGRSVRVKNPELWKKLKNRKYATEQVQE